MADLEAFSDLRLAWVVQLSGALRRVFNVHERSGRCTSTYALVPAACLGLWAARRVQRQTQLGGPGNLEAALRLHAGTRRKGGRDGAAVVHTVHPEAQQVPLLVSCLRRDRDIQTQLSHISETLP